MKNLIEKIVKNRSSHYDITDVFVDPSTGKNIINIFDRIENVLVGSIDFDAVQSRVNYLIEESISYKKSLIGKHTNREDSIIKSTNISGGIKVIKIDDNELSNVIISKLYEEQNENGFNTLKVKLTGDDISKIKKFISNKTSFNIDEIIINENPFYEFYYCSITFIKFPIIKFEYKPDDFKETIDGAYKSIMSFKEMQKENPYMEKFELIDNAYEPLLTQ